MKEHYLWQN